MSLNNTLEESRNLDAYFNRLSEHPLLTKQEEIELGTLVQAWFKNKSNCGKRVRKKGKDALKKLIQSNLRLVIKISKEYRNLGLDFEDLVSEGNFGLLKAAERFEPEKGARFSTYASYWIKQYIRRGLSNKSRTIRLPVGLIEQKNKVRTFISEYELSNSRKPSSSEICKKFNINKIKLITLLEVDKTPLSIDSPPSGSDESETRTFSDVLQDNSSLLPDSVAEINSDNLILKKCLMRLNRRERAIIEYRFGLKNKNFETLEKIGVRFRVTRERIRQIEEAALRKLRFWIKKYNIK